MSGKEAAVYVVRSGGEIRCAKVYKEAHQRASTSRPPIRKGARAETADKPRHGEAHAIWAQGTGGRMAERRSGRTIPPRRGRSTRPAALRVRGRVLLMELVTDGKGNAARGSATWS